MVLARVIKNGQVALDGLKVFALRVGEERDFPAALLEQYSDYFEPPEDGKQEAAPEEERQASRRGRPKKRPSESKMLAGAPENKRV